ncbi:MAG TPA: hypothetical protein VMY43_10295 [Methanothrix sp.]|nr:hypothetical protein [Methanothrix sp.]
MLSEMEVMGLVTKSDFRFANEIRRLTPFYAKRKLDLALGRRTPRDFFQEDLASGELCKGVV